MNAPTPSSAPAEKLLSSLEGMHSVKATCRITGSREIVCPLICQLMDKRGDGYGAFWSGAATAMDAG